MKKLFGIPALFIVALIFFVSGCGTDKAVLRALNQQTMAINNMADAMRSTNVQADDGDAVVANYDEESNNDSAVTDETGNAIPIETFTDDGEIAVDNSVKTESAEDDIVADTAPAKEKPLSVEERVAKLEKKFGNHERRLSKLEKVTNQMGEDLERIIKQAGGLNDIDYFTVKFSSGSSQVSEEREAQISVLCKKYKEEAEKTGKKLRLLLRGYADKNGNEKDNEKLSEDRAKAVKSLCEKQLSGIGYSIETEGHGEKTSAYTDANSRIVKIIHEFVDIEPVAPTPAPQS